MFDFAAFPTLHTKRLTLRQIVHADAEGIFQIRGDYKVTRMNTGAAYTSVEQAHELIAGMKRDYDEKTTVRWGITRTAFPDDVIGMCGYNVWHRVDRRASIGYDLARVHWRQGIMREAVAAILGFGFTEMDLNRAEADAGSDNVASIALLRSLGFQYEGLQREQYFEEGRFQDLELFGLLRREWQEQQKPRQEQR